MAAMSATSALRCLGMIPGVRRQWGGKGGIIPRPPSALVALIAAMLNAFHRLFGSNEKETPECA